MPWWPQTALAVTWPCRNLGRAVYVYRNAVGVVRLTIGKAPGALSWYVFRCGWQVIPTKYSGAMLQSQELCGIFEAQAKIWKQTLHYHSTGDWNLRKGFVWLLKTSRTPWKMRKHHWSNGDLHFMDRTYQACDTSGNLALAKYAYSDRGKWVARNFITAWNWEKSRQVYAAKGELLLTRF